MEITTFSQLFTQLFTGQNLAILGAALAATLAGIGSVKGVALVGEASSGILSEDPSKFGKALLLQALPGTQGIYGLIVAFMVINNLGLFSGAVKTLSVSQGLYYLIACLPIAIVGFYSGVKQGRVAASGMNILAKRPDDFGKGIIAAALVETYAIFALLVSLLLIIFA